MTEKLVKGRFIVTVLVELLLFVLALNGKMSGSEAGLAMTAVAGGFMHFDTKDAP